MTMTTQNTSLRKLFLFLFRFVLPSPSNRAPMCSRVQCTYSRQVVWASLSHLLAHGVSVWGWAVSIMHWNRVECFGWIARARQTSPRHSYIGTHTQTPKNGWETCLNLDNEKSHESTINFFLEFGLLFFRKQIHSFRWDITAQFMAAVRLCFGNIFSVSLTAKSFSKKCIL